MLIETRAVLHDGSWRAHLRSRSPESADVNRVRNETKWRLDSHCLLWVKRYYILDAFDDCNVIPGPHLATTRVITPRQRYDGHTLQEADDDARADIFSFLETGKGGDNTVRFRDGDVLPMGLSWFRE